MLTTLLLLALSVNPQAPRPPQAGLPCVDDTPPAPKVKTCLCSERCVCGCNSGQECRCQSRQIPASNTGAPVFAPGYMPAPAFAPSYAPAFAPSYAPAPSFGGFGGYSGFAAPSMGGAACPT